MKEKNFINEKLGMKVKILQNEDGSILINAEDTVRGFGFIKIDRKGGKEYTRLDFPRLQKYIEEFNFGNEFPKLKKDDYIPESLFYLLGMKASNKVAQEFQKWLAMEIIPQLRRTGVVMLEHAEEEAIDYEKKFGTYRIRKTFNNSNDLKADTLKLSNRKNGQEKSLLKDKLIKL